MQDFVKVLFGKWAIVKNIDTKLEDYECIKLASALRALLFEGKLKCTFTHIANEHSGAKRPRFGLKLKAMGKVSGAADYVFISDDGRGIWVEMKRPDGKGRQSAEQKAFQEWGGGNYHLCTTAQQVIDLLIERDFISV